MIQEWFDAHSTYVLINGTQYQVVLDDQNDPTEFWSTILFQVGDTVLTDGGKPQLTIVERARLSNNFEVRRYRMTHQVSGEDILNSPDIDEPHLRIVDDTD